MVTLEDSLRRVMTTEEGKENATATAAFNAILARKDGFDRLWELYWGSGMPVRFDTAESLANAWERSQRNIGCFASEMQWN